MFFLLLLLGSDEARSQKTTIVVSPQASPAETLAASDLSRYVYLRTRDLPKITRSNGVRSDRSWGKSILVARKDHVLASSNLSNAELSALKPQNYLLKTLKAADGRKIQLIIGGDDAGVLYGAYRFIEKLGVRFYLHGDVVPDAPISTDLPAIDETGAPIFELRGIQPFHDFPEGPDWWNRDDYLTYIAQMPKMRLNFLGLHTYPEGSAGPEPAVWIGARGDFDARGRVNSSYSSRWANTAIPVRWGYQGMKTSEYSGGAAALFEADDFGPDVMKGMGSAPTTPAQQNRLFNNAGELLGDAFSQARALGVKVAIGTETPLTIPKTLQERLIKAGKDPQDPNVVREMYGGLFERISRAYPIDYYWLWTPENWIWGGNKPGQFEATTQDIGLALEALKQSGAPFKLATSGWVLGPQQDRAALDRFLPADSPMSSINQFHSHAAVDPALANIVGRPKWAIPWLENDPSLTTPQPWVGRLRYDAADARRLGATGLIGLHWRTASIAPNIAALAAAGWNQDYVPGDFDTTPIEPRPVVTIGAVGGQDILGTTPVAGTTIDPIYQSVRVKMEAYNLEIPRGTYRVILQFNEATYGEVGKRVFSVKIAGKTVIEKLDIFARAGKNTALDIPVSNVRVADGLMKIEFVPQVDFPLVSALIVEGTTDSGVPFTRKINSAGGAYFGYEAERLREAPAAQRNRSLPSADFYLDFARASFGEEVAREAGAILTRTDGVAMPSPSNWIQGPGGVKIDPLPWQEAKSRYDFVDELAALRSRVQGEGNKSRFEAWLTTFRAAEAMAQVGSVRGQLDAAMSALKAGQDAVERDAVERDAVERNAVKKTELAAKALSLRLELAQTWAAMMSLHVAATQTPGEMGVLTNLEGHSRRWLKFVNFHDEALVAALGQPLPSAAEPSRAYQGRARIIVPTVRSLVAPGENLDLKVMLLSPENEPTPRGALFWRPLKTGQKQGRFRRIPLAQVARSVYRATLPAQKAGTTLEYYIQANLRGREAFFPATAPNLNQTVVVWDAQSQR